MRYLAILIFGLLSSFVTNTIYYSVNEGARYPVAYLGGAVSIFIVFLISEYFDNRRGGF